MLVRAALVLLLQLLCNPHHGEDGSYEPQHVHLLQRALGGGNQNRYGKAAVVRVGGDQPKRSNGVRPQQRVL